MMKTLITILAGALIAFGNLNAEGVTSSKELRDNAPARSAGVDPWVAYWTSETVTSHVNDLLVAEELDGDDRTVLNLYLQARYLGGQWNAKDVSTEDRHAALAIAQKASRHTWIARLQDYADEDAAYAFLISTLPDQGGSWVYAQAYHLDFTYEYGLRLRLLPDLIGQGVVTTGYWRMVDNHMRPLPVEEQITILRSEIEGLLYAPQSDGRDKRLVELRGRLRILQEL